MQRPSRLYYFSPSIPSLFKYCALSVSLSLSFSLLPSLSSPLHLSTPFPPSPYLSLSRCSPITTPTLSLSLSLSLSLALSQKQFLELFAGLYAYGASLSILAARRRTVGRRRHCLEEGELQSIDNCLPEEARGRAERLQDTLARQQPSGREKRRPSKPR